MADLDYVLNTDTTQRSSDSTSFVSLSSGDILNTDLTGDTDYLRMFFQGFAGGSTTNLYEVQIHDALPKLCKKKNMGPFSNGTTVDSANRFR